MMSALTSEDFDDLHDYIRLHVTAGFAPVGAIVDDAVEAFVGSSIDAVALRHAARAVADQALTAHRADQAAWPGQTDCDRIDAAFAELEQAGIVARQHFSCCGTCGADEILDELKAAAKAGRSARGYTFFHVQDTEQAIAGESLYLSYGSGSKDRGESVAIGHEVVAVLGRHGLSPSWNGKIAHRIALPVVWQRRRP